MQPGDEVCLLCEQQPAGELGQVRAVVRLKACYMTVLVTLHVRPSQTAASGCHAVVVLLSLLPQSLHAAATPGPLINSLLHLLPPLLSLLPLQQLGADEYNTALCLRGLSPAPEATLFDELPDCTPRKA